MLRYKHNHVVTSTPIKKQTSQLLKMDQWPSPLESTPTPTPTPTPASPYSLAKVDEDKNLCHSNNKRREKSDSVIHAETGSVDKICLVNNLPNVNNAENNEASRCKVGIEIEDKKKWIIIESDDDSIWESKSKPVKRRKKNVASLTDAGKASIFEEAENRGIDDIARMKLKKNKYPNRDNLKISKARELNESSNHSDSRLHVTSSKKRASEKRCGDENLNVRKSSRKRCKPLEFWNGERMNTERDLSYGFGSNNARENSRGKKSKETRKAGSESERMDKICEISTSLMTNLTKSRESIRNSRNLNTKIDDKIERKEERTRSKLSKSKNSKAGVKFSLAVIETTADDPINDENSKPDEQENIVELQALMKQRIPANKNYIIIPQLKNIIGNISSAVIVIEPTLPYENKASNQHHSIYCVMAGLVKVMIMTEGSKTYEEMKPCRHFVVPCGAFYSIRSVDGKRAVLSWFEIPSGINK